MAKILEKRPEVKKDANFRASLQAMKELSDELRNNRLPKKEALRRLNN